MLLIHADAILDNSDENGCTALHKATLSGHRDCIEPLIYYGADINAVCQEKPTSGLRSALYFTRSGNYSLAEFLLHQKANPDPETCSPLFTALLHKHRDTVQLLLKNGASLEGALLAACDVSSLSVVEKLLARGADACATREPDGRTALILAAYGGCEPVVKKLLNAGVDVHARTVRRSTALLVAVRKGHKGVAELLLGRGALVDVKNDRGYPILKFPAREGNESMVKLLLRSGATVDNVDEDKQTLLLVAASEGNDSVVRLLLRNGASIDKKTLKGLTDLAIAAWGGYTTVVGLLLAKGAEIDTRDDQGSTPLILAAYKGHSEVIKLLVKEGADITLKDNFGETASD